MGCFSVGSAEPRGVFRLRVASTWDGLSVPLDEQAELVLTGHEDHLELGIDAPYHGDPAPESPAGSLPGLWNYEVVELFIAGVDDRYLEVEVGPHGHYLVLQLEGVRNVVEQGLGLDVTVCTGPERWTARAILPRRWLPPGSCRINAYSVHGLGEHRRYLANTPVPGDGPDFHRLHFFRDVQLP